MSNENNEIQVLEGRVAKLERLVTHMKEQANQRVLTNLCMQRAVNALMRTHPEPEAFRTAWDQEVAQMWTEVVQVAEGQPSMKDQMVAVQVAFESVMRDRLD